MSKFKGKSKHFFPREGDKFRREPEIEVASWKLQGHCGLFFANIARVSTNTTILKDININRNRLGAYYSTKIHLIS